MKKIRIIIKKHFDLEIMTWYNSIIIGSVFITFLQLLFKNTSWIKSTWVWIAEKYCKCFNFCKKYRREHPILNDLIVIKAYTLMQNIPKYSKTFFLFLKNLYSPFFIKTSDWIRKNIAECPNDDFTWAIIYWKQLHFQNQ